MKRLCLVLAIIAIIFCQIGRLEAANPKTNARGAGTTDILRQDILRLIGPTTDRDVQKSSVPGDSFLVRLNRRMGETPMLYGNAQYGMLVRGIDPVERALLQDAQDGKWDHFDLFRAAMIVEGIRDPNQIRAYEAKLNAVLTKANETLQAGQTSVAPEALTRELFETLHRELLTKPYDINCTELGKVLETGHFNCVSATVLFNVLAEKAGLDVCALEMPGHALSRVKFGNTNSMNVETTCPNWFALQTEAARTNATMQRIAPTHAEAGQPVGNSVGGPSAATVESAAELNDISKKLREITPVQLIATIYYNQGVDLHAEKRYAEAALANIKALHLDPNSETAWGNLMAAMNNWAIEIVSETKRYDLAATLLDQGVYLDPTYDKFKANQLHVYYYWIRDLANEGRKADAKTVFALADQRLPGDKHLAELMQAIDRM